MKFITMTALAVMCGVVSAHAGSMSAQKNWGAQSGDSSGAPTGRHLELDALVGNAQDGANLSGRSSYTTILNHTCGICIETNVGGTGNSVNTGVDQHGDTTGTQDIGTIKR